jgi:hypothetical protein
MEAPVISHDGPIVIEETPAQKQGEAPKEVAGDEECVEGDVKYRQPMWCPRGLNKTQRHKLQCARHKQQKREMLAKMEGEVLNPEHVESPLKDQNAAAAAGQSAKPTPVLSQSAKPTAPVPAGLGVPESAKPTPPAGTAPEALESARPTPESAELTPTVPVAFEVSSDDFASTIAAMVGMEVPEVPDEEMSMWLFCPPITTSLRMIQPQRCSTSRYKMPHSRNQNILSIISSLCM